jgi:hypothetical protein
LTPLCPRLDTRWRREIGLDEKAISKVLGWLVPGARCRARASGLEAAHDRLTCTLRSACDEDPFAGEFRRLDLELLADLHVEISNRMI